MKYTYAYKTSDGVRHEDSMNAASREEVFAELRKRGIKAIKVVASDGSKANGEVQGVRKRIVAMFVCIAALITGLAVYFAPVKPTTASTATTKSTTTPSAKAKNATSLPRQMIHGDRARIKEAAESLTNAAERVLAAFAEPGRTFVLESKLPTEAEFAAVLSEPITIAENEFTESVDLKRIVTRIKGDMRRYLSAGGSVQDFIAELVKRQKQEIAYRKKAESRLKELLSADSAKAYDFFLKANAQLQSMGIYPLPLPDSLRSYQNTLDFDE